MASRNIKLLNPELQDRITKVKDFCKQNEVDILIYCTVRSLDEQAILYCMSNPREKVEEKIEKFHNRRLGFLAKFLEKHKAIPFTEIKTVSAPGESYHSYGEAFDAVPLLSGKAMWNYNEYKKGWDVYAQALRNNGLKWGGDFQDKFRDITHAQLSPGSNPLKIFPPEVIKAILIEIGML